MPAEAPPQSSRPLSDTIPPVKVRVVAFATAAEILGGRESIVDQPEGARVSELLDSLEHSFPGFDKIRERLAIAIGGRLVGLNEKLADGAEVALLPPVSGGKPNASRRLVRQPIDVKSLIRETADQSCGAQLVFLGRVRSGPGGKKVTHLTYDAYEEMASQALDRICGELGAAEPGLRVEIVHRLGEVPVGEPSVAIVANSPHRAAAYEASRAALERIKKEVPIWKREHFVDGSASWREEERLDAS